MFFRHRASEWKNQKFNRLVAYFKYKSFIYKHLKSNNYKRIIICNLTLILFLFDIKKIHKGKIIYDIRDYSIVIDFFKPILKIYLKSSEYNFISSIGFKYWLPKNINYKLIHNLDLIKKHI